MQIVQPSYLLLSILKDCVGPGLETEYPEKLSEEQGLVP